MTQAGHAVLMNQQHTSDHADREQAGAAAGLLLSARRAAVGGLGKDAHVMPADPGRRRPHTAPTSPRTPRLGFTLIELLVVVSIIAILLAILLPSLNHAREQARTAACASQLKAVGAGLAAYAAESDGWIPGLNTSGVPLRVLQYGGGRDADALRDPDLPVQPQDWVTPLIRKETSLPASRAKRFHMVTNKYRCPSQVTVKSRLFFQGNVPDREDFEQISDWTALSYLMPVHFQFWGQNDAGKVLGGSAGRGRRPVTSRAAPDNWEVRVDSYVSRVNRIGPPERKIAVADGTRYLTAEGILDHDVSPWPTNFGSFTSSGAWWAGSTAYGVKSGSRNWDGDTVSRGSPSDGQNLALSYRHRGRKVRLDGTVQGNNGAINAMFFDGHVDRLTDRPSRRIEYWYPTGAVVQNPQEGLTTVPQGYVVP